MYGTSAQLTLQMKLQKIGCRSTTQEVTLLQDLSTQELCKLCDDSADGMYMQSAHVTQSMSNRQLGVTCVPGWRPTCADSWRVHCSCSSSVVGLSLNVGMASRASAGMAGRLAGRVRTAARSSHNGSFCGRRLLSGPTIPLWHPNLVLVVRIVTTGLPAKAGPTLVLSTNMLSHYNRNCTPGSSAHVFAVNH